MKTLDWAWKNLTIPGRLGADAKSYLWGGAVGLATGAYCWNRWQKVQKEIEDWNKKRDEALEFANMAIKAKKLVDKDISKKFPGLKWL